MGEGDVGVNDGSTGQYFSVPHLFQLDSSGFHWNIPMCEFFHFYLLYSEYIPGHFRLFQVIPGHSS